MSVDVIRLTFTLWPLIEVVVHGLFCTIFFNLLSLKLAKNNAAIILPEPYSPINIILHTSLLVAISLSWDNSTCCRMTSDLSCCSLSLVLSLSVCDWIPFFTEAVNRPFHRKKRLSEMTIDSDSIPRIL